MRKLLLFVGQISAYAKNTSDTSVLSAVVLYVTNFFTCAECGENFERETQDYRGFLADGKSAIKYLWQVITKIIFNFNQKRINFTVVAVNELIFLYVNTIFNMTKKI